MISIYDSKNSDSTLLIHGPQRLFQRIAQRPLNHINVMVLIKHRFSIQIFHICNMYSNIATYNNLCFDNLVLYS